jgi:hypothetical protein
MKTLENKTKDAPKKKIRENYLIKIMGYILDGIKPDENVSSNNILVYSPKYLGRNN